MGSAFDDFMSGSFDQAGEVFGTEPVLFEGMDDAVEVDFNATATREELEVNGVIIGVTATILVKKSLLTIPPKVNQRVTRKCVAYVISGTLSEDELTYSLALDSTDVAQPVQ